MVYCGTHCGIYMWYIMQCDTWYMVYCGTPSYIEVWYIMQCGTWYMVPGVLWYTPWYRSVVHYAVM